MFKRTHAAAAAIAFLGFAIGGIACATGPTKEAEDEDEKEVPITGEALKKASAAALAFTGGGRVTGTEVGDEESYYEVEVTLEDGHQVDVQLDEHFKVVSADSDDEEEGDDEED